MTDTVNLPGPSTPPDDGRRARSRWRAEAFLLLALAVLGPVLVAAGYVAYVLITAL